jgi:hypothetical protein
MTTLVLASLIALAVWVVRHRSRMLAEVWQAARWWERAVLLLALAPVPGPFEELAGVLVARKVADRVARDAAR